MKYFEISEFDSPDVPGSGEEMKQPFLNALELTRIVAGIPFIITSGYRTPDHNKKVGGKQGSSHTKGWAADISCRSSRERFKIIRAAIKSGITRIGVSQNFIHLDMDPNKPNNVIWTY